MNTRLGVFKVKMEFMNTMCGWTYRYWTDFGQQIVYWIYWLNDGGITNKEATINKLSDHHNEDIVCYFFQNMSPAILQMINMVSNDVCMYVNMERTILQCHLTSSRSCSNKTKSSYDWPYCLKIIYIYIYINDYTYIYI